MKKENIFKLLAALSCLIIITLFSVQINEQSIENEPLESVLKTSGAGKALDMWSFERAYPNDKIPTASLMAAFEESKLNQPDNNRGTGDDWESMGPENIGGRTLCLAFHPTDEDIMFAGSASGGLWKSTTAGLGQFAWEYVPTGFPVLGVGAIAIDQNDPNIMFIGTGETYGVGQAEPGTVNRLTRGTYGIGILKSIDGGVNWNHVLDFDEDDLKGVQDLEINPQNSLEMFAATTDGIYRSVDGGDNWTLVFNQPNCIDIEIDPSNGDILYVSQGNFNYPLNPALSGIYKSTDKGDNFTELLDPGLITAWSGNAKLSIDPANSDIIYADIQVGWFNTGATTPAGIFRSTNGGTNWTLVNNQNIAQFQGWYSHDLAINPQDSSEMIMVGIAAWKSNDTGANFTQNSTNSWTMGEVSVDFPEGGDDYVHSDIHAVYYHPINNKVYFASDGGVFVSDDGEQPFTTLNGGLQTTQFYADMASSNFDPGFLIAGAQDNASYVYKGSPSWFRVIGGDGMTTAIKQTNDDIVYGSAQGLRIFKSVNGGDNYFEVSPSLVGGDYPSFSAPYKLAPTNNEIIYGATTYLYKSEDGGDNWITTSNQSVDGGNVILKIAISPFDSDILLLTTAPDPLGNFGDTPKVFKTIDGGQNFTEMAGLPNRVSKDIEFDPTDDSVAYITYSGFGSDHVYKTTDGGDNWLSIDNGLPDVPTNTIAIDPLNSDELYVGNDLGVYYSDNGGGSWIPFVSGLPEAVMVYDLNVVRPPIRKLRIATHGHGIYQRNFVSDPLAVNDVALSDNGLSLYPNPASSHVTIEMNLDMALSDATVEVYNVLGQKVVSIYEGNLSKGRTKFTWSTTQNIEAGAYFIRLVAEGQSITKTLIVN